MEEQKIDLNQIIVIEQLPKIRETLGVISEELDRVIEEALALDCTEESKTTVKKRRADLNIVKRELEIKRKQAKEQIMKPYEEFEAVYNELVKNKLDKADETLKERITAIEAEQLSKKENELLEFAEEHIKFHDLTAIIDAKRVLPRVTLSASTKSLKEQIKGEIERIANEITIIKQEEHPEEVLMQYLENDFDYPKAKLQVLENHRKQEELEHMFLTVDNDYEVKEATIAPIEEEVITPPKEVVEEELIECTFTVNATKEQLIQIKNYLQELGVKYE